MCIYLPLYAYSRLLPLPKGRGDEPPACRIPIESSSNNWSESTKPFVAVTSASKGPTLPDSGPVNLRIQQPLKPAVMSDTILAAIAKKGKDVGLAAWRRRRDPESTRTARRGAWTSLALQKLNGLLSSRSKPNLNLETHRQLLLAILTGFAIHGILAGWLMVPCALGHHRHHSTPRAMQENEFYLDT